MICLNADKLIIGILKLKSVLPLQHSFRLLQSITESPCWFSAVHAVKADYFSFWEFASKAGPGAEGRLTSWWLADSMLSYTGVTGIQFVDQSLFNL